jgi:predicted nucleic acid-binding protein
LRAGRLNNGWTGKLVVKEAGSELAAQLWDGCDAALASAVERQAGELARGHALRGADCVHLASALAIGDPDLVIAVWDRRLHAGALAAGSSVAPAVIA